MAEKNVDIQVQLMKVRGCKILGREPDWGLDRFRLDCVCWATVNR